MARAPRGPERPDAAKGDQRSLDAKDLEIGATGSLALPAINA